MNKSELVDAVSQSAGTSRADTQKILEATLDTIRDALARGEDVSLPGFGKFSVSERAARPGTNPSTGEKIQIAASKSPKFSAGSALKTAVNT